jgi:hypothetical protein
MPRYYFSLANGRVFNDVDGLELPDLVAARAEAIGFARDLMRLEPERRDWARWTVRVRTIIGSPCSICRLRKRLNKARTFATRDSQR